MVEFSDLWQKLEAERNDLSYRKTEDSPPIQQVVYVDRVKPNPKRDKLMFAAGRYAAGARDKTACKAHEWLEKDLSKDA